MRIIKMHQKKKGPRRFLVQPSQGARHHFLGPALGGVVAVLSRANMLEARIVGVESALKTRRQVRFGIEHNGPYEGSSPVSLGSQDGRRKRQVLRQLHAEIGDLVE